MKDLLLKLVDNRFAVNSFLGQLDRSLISRGQLLLTSSAITSLISVFTDESFAISELQTRDDGTVSFNARAAGSLELGYTVKIDSLCIQNGRVSGSGTYTESRRGGGIGGALLGITGKSGLSLALAGKKWISVDSQSFKIAFSGLPSELDIVYSRTTRQGILFRIS